MIEIIVLFIGMIFISGAGSFISGYLFAKQRCYFEEEEFMFIQAVKSEVLRK